MHVVLSQFGHKFDRVLISRVFRHPDIDIGHCHEPVAVILRNLKPVLRHILRATEYDTLTTLSATDNEMAWAGHFSLGQVRDCLLIGINVQ